MRRGLEPIEDSSESEGENAYNGFSQQAFPHNGGGGGPAAVGAQQQQQSLYAPPTSRSSISTRDRREEQQLQSQGRGPSTVRQASIQNADGSPSAERGTTSTDHDLGHGRGGGRTDSSESGSIRVHDRMSSESTTTSSSTVFDAGRQTSRKRGQSPLVLDPTAPFEQTGLVDPFSTTTAPGSSSRRTKPITTTSAEPLARQSTAAAGREQQQSAARAGSLQRTKNWFSAFGRALASSVDAVTTSVFGQGTSEEVRVVETHNPYALTNESDQSSTGYSGDQALVRMTSTGGNAAGSGRTPFPPGTLRIHQHPQEPIYAAEENEDGEYDGYPLPAAGYAVTPVADDGSFGDRNQEGSPSLHFNLVAAIRQYRRLPVDAFFSLVSTTVKARSLTQPISGAEFAECGGDHALVALLINSFKLNYEDPRLVDELQYVIYAVTTPAPETGRVQPGNYEILQHLLKTPCVRLSEEQRDVLLDSGFEFVQLLCTFDPYRIERKAVCGFNLLHRISRALDPLVVIFGLLVIYFDWCVIVYIGYHWSTEQDYSAFNLSLLVVAIGTVLSFIGHKIVNTTREPDSSYGENISDMPSVWLKVLPIIPLFETFCGVACLKHCFCGKGYSIIRHDLSAMFTLSRLIHSLFISAQQILVQTYFFIWRNQSTTSTTSSSSEGFIGYDLLVASSLISIFSSFPLYLRSTYLNYSVNSMGFAFSSARMPRTDEEKVSNYSRVLSVILLYLMQFNIFMLIVAVTNVKDCSTLMIVWICLSAVLIIITIAMIVRIMINTRDLFAASLWLILPILLQIGFTIFMSVYDQGQDQCQLFFAIGAVNIVFGYVGWGLLVLVAFMWFIQHLLEDYRKKKLRQSAIAADAAGRPGMVPAGGSTSFGPGDASSRPTTLPVVASGSDVTNTDYFASPVYLPAPG